MDIIRISDHLGLERQGFERAEEMGSLASRVVPHMILTDAGRKLENSTNWKLDELEEYLGRVAKEARLAANTSDVMASLEQAGVFR